jgi:hypothetical protein
MLNTAQIEVSYNEEIQKRIKAGEYRLTPNGPKLNPMGSISNIWEQPPLDGHIHVFVGLPRGWASSRKWFVFS